MKNFVGKNRNQSAETWNIYEMPRQNGRDLIINEETETSESQSTKRDEHIVFNLYKLFMRNESYSDVSAPSKR